MIRVYWQLYRRRKVFQLSSLFLPSQTFDPRTANFSFFVHEQFFIYFIYNAPSLGHPTLTFINPQAPQVQSQAPKSWQKYQLIKMSHFPCPKKKSADSRQTKETENKPTPATTTTKTTAKPTINIKSKNVCYRRSSTWKILRDFWKKNIAKILNSFLELLHTK